MGKFKDDIEHIELLLTQADICDNPVQIKCVTNGYESEVNDKMDDNFSLLIIIQNRRHYLNS